MDLSAARTLLASGNYPDRVSIESGVTIIDPRKFLESHISTIEKNGLNRQGKLHIERLEQFYNQVVKGYCKLNRI